MNSYPNPVIRLLMETKSVRAFEERPIGAAEREAVLRAAMAAPTAGNQQLYTIIEVDEQRILDELAELCDHQPFIAKAPLALVFCTDVRRWRDTFLEAGAELRAAGPGDLLLAAADALIAAQNAVVAAASLGIGSCYIGDILENRGAERRLLNLPEQVLPVAMLVLGYPTQAQLEKKKPERCGLAHIVHKNAYRLRTGQELREMTSASWESTSFESWGQRLCGLKYNSDFSAEMNRSAAEYLADYNMQPTKTW